MIKMCAVGEMWLVAAYGIHKSCFGVSGVLVCLVCWSEVSNFHI